MPKTKRNFLGFGTKTTHYRPRPERVSRLRQERREEQKTATRLRQKALKSAEDDLADATRKLGAVLRRTGSMTSAEKAQQTEARAIVAQYEARLADAKAGRAVKANPGLTGRFKACVKAVKAKGGAYDPKAVCASEERRRYGQKALTKASIAGKKRAARKRAKGKKNPTLKTADGRKLKVSRKGAKAIKRLLEMDSLPGKPLSLVRVPGAKRNSLPAGGEVLGKQLTKAHRGKARNGRPFTKGQKVSFYVGSTLHVGKIVRATPSTQTVIYTDGKKARTAEIHHTKLFRRNPEAESVAMYEVFHGKEPESIVEYQTPVHEHTNLWCVGDFSVMNVKTIHGEKWAIGVCPAEGNQYPDPSQLPIDKRVVLAANEKGDQLYFIGGDQSLDPKQYGLKAADIKDHTLIGTIEYIVYQTRKGFDKFELTDYGHRAGEESGVKPMLVYQPRSKTMSVVGGQYRLQRPGIIN